MQQGSEEWFKSRCGSIGASDVARIVRKTMSGYSADRATLMSEKIQEKLTGVNFQRQQTQAMRDGIEREPVARIAYAIKKNVYVDEIAFVPHPLIPGAHASPDGLVGELGLIEIKCPEGKRHVEALLTETIPSDHLVQMMWQMACTGRAFCDYVSFHPGFPKEMAMWIKRVPRVETHIKDLETEVRAFIKEVNQKISKLTTRYASAA